VGVALLSLWGRAAPARPAWLRMAVVWILAANGADLGLTVWGLELRVIAEANPIFARMMAISPVLAGVLKMGVAAGALWFLYRVYPRNPRLVTAGVAVVGIAMAIVLIMHADWLRAAGVM